MRWIFVTAVTCAAAACGSPSMPDVTTGLSGIVLRGPVTPTCSSGISCEEPFGAHFTVERSGRVVAQFRSDAQGRFTVFLAPGRYSIVPGSDAPILWPQAQAKTVDIGAVGLTTASLEFDTGIR